MHTHTHTQSPWALRQWCSPVSDSAYILVSLQALVAEQESKDSGGAAVAEQVLSIMEMILDESNAEPLSEDKVSGAESFCPQTLGACSGLLWS